MARVRIVGTPGKDNLDERRIGESDIFGRGGNDTIRLLRDDDLGGDNTVDAGPGNDKVLNLFEGGNRIKLGPGNDTYVGSGFTAFNDLDVVRGNSGNDRFIVSTLQSTYSGDGGNDTFISEGHANTFRGGTGTDTIDYSARSNSNVVGDQAVTVDLSQNEVQTGPIKIERLASIENATGTRLSDILTGNDGPNVLKGLEGDDDLNGLAGNDTLIGGPGIDFISGDAGNDRLTGNTETDGFLFRVAPTPANADVITDFNPAQDVIGLSAAIFPGLPVGALDASRLRIGPAATNSGHRVIYDSVTGRVFFDGDGSGVTQAQLVCTIPVNLNITPPNIEIF
ncbi:MAG: calcium-binding protein [Verrucomicrobiota bacterium]